eukprot:CAMPEP_0201256528 /NCGR_PEP_ID=MMETSP0853-20130426/753_1 /ASSEMBLY_ACC=CAM_ASM_000640 /TAXON_ID=183588 /ORGANISM="Pseudo-nitzschia fraudulenta, Strain WWA7" /LENGTH=99 /DNA_ID=CAMNT_0047556785 /DNA_START=178 /DNA_END=477 /DNA_ORIENTATION=-
MTWVSWCNNPVGSMFKVLETSLPNLFRGLFGLLALALALIGLLALALLALLGQSARLFFDVGNRSSEGLSGVGTGGECNDNEKEKDGLDRRGHHLERLM